MHSRDASLRAHLLDLARLRSGGKCASVQDPFVHNTIDNDDQDCCDKHTKHVDQQQPFAVVRQRRFGSRLREAE